MLAPSTWSIALANILADPAPPLEPERTCGSCKEIKPVSQFYQMGGRYSYRCKQCHKTHVYKKRATK